MTLVEALLVIDPVMYQDYVTTDKKGEKYYKYVQISKALYGLLKSALDFYNKLCPDLEGDGF